jgi:hypothetical protein
VVAREYMIRLNKTDLADRASVERLANAAGITADDFTARFKGAVESDSLPEQATAHAR